MFAHLPTHIKDKLVRLLETNEFPAAKKLYDQWTKSNN